MTTRDLLLAGLNALNTTPTPFTDANVLFSNPITVTGDTWNTRVTLTGVPGGPFKNSVDVRYRRLELASLNSPGVNPQVSSVDPFSTAILAAALSPTEVGRPSLTEEDILPVVFPAGMAEGQTYTVLVQADPSSLGWTGNTYVDIVYGVPADLDGFHNLINSILPAALA